MFRAVRDICIINIKYHNVNIAFVVHDSKTTGFIREEFSFNLVEGHKNKMFFIVERFWGTESMLLLMVCSCSVFFDERSPWCCWFMRTFVAYFYSLCA